MIAVAAKSATPQCPICGGTVFGPGPKGRMAPNGSLPRCAGCQSLERHRIFRIMFEKLGPKNFAGWKAIQFSPDPTVDPSWFAAHELSVYGEPGGLDIQAIDRPDAAYDFVICSHVLEHVGDDRAALGELLRIAKPDGLLFLAFPDPFREDVTRDWGFPSRKNMVTGVSMAPMSLSASAPTSRPSRCLPIAGRIRSPANGKARSCCPGRLRDIAGSSTGSATRLSYSPARRSADFEITSAERRSSRSGRTFLVAS